MVLQSILKWSTKLIIKQNKPICLMVYYRMLLFIALNLFDFLSTYFGIRLRGGWGNGLQQKIANCDTGCGFLHFV
jgi:hypothetical protein